MLHHVQQLRNAANDYIGTEPNNSQLASSRLAGLPRGMQPDFLDRPVAVKLAGV
jgi:hypothetical protein